MRLCTTIRWRPIVAWRHTAPTLYRSLCTGINSSRSADWQYFSFYKYAPIQEPEALRDNFLKDWEQLGVLGRVYVAKEGVNGQVAVPPGQERAFQESIVSKQPLQDCFINIGEKITAADPFPFEKLKVKVRSKIVNDGLEEPLDLEDRGEAVPPQEWHQLIENRDEKTLILDCRNAYEHEIGRFEGSERVMVDVFRNTFQVLDEKLKERVAEDTKVMIYCTGGIRCEKVGAYLRNNLKVKDVKRLEGGIVRYIEYVKSHGSELESKFKGKNYVFDERSFHGGSVKATDDVLGKCLHCGTPYDNHRNCSNKMCGKVQLQCPACAERLKGACSPACMDAAQEMSTMSEEEQRLYRKKNAHRFKPEVRDASNRYGIVAGPMFSTTSRSLFTWSGSRHTLVERYADDVSSKLKSSQREEALPLIRQRTEETLPRPQMISPVLQGRLLRFLALSVRAKRILEIGTFSGFALVCMLDALPPDGQLVSCDIDSAALDVAREATKEDNRVDLRQCDGVQLLQDLHASDQPPFDLIFVDANKRSYTTYYDTILKHDLVSPQGLLVFDNTLFKGDVLDPNPNQRIASSIAAFNAHVARDPRTETLCLPIWDGLTLIQLSS